MEIVTKFIFGKEVPPSNVAAFIKKSVNSYKKMLIEEGSIAPYYDERRVKVIYNSNGLLTLSCKEVLSYGQIHPQTTTKFKCFDLSQSKQMELYDLFQDNFSTELLKIAEEQFYMQLALDKTKSLKEQDFRFTDNKFRLNDNFYINTDGLHFYYNNYEIRAYGYGPTDLVIPWSKIEHLLKENIKKSI
ncbi:MAG: RsiV family protein [Ignavibacteria bacterium]|jgi:hypothetical protein